MDTIPMPGRAEDVADTMTLAEALFPVANGGGVMFHPASAAAVRHIIELMEEVIYPTPLQCSVQALQVVLTL
jgi:hypothetical protein